MNHLRSALAVLVLTSSLVGAQTPAVDHQGVGCVVAERFPRLEARFVPVENVATARVFFQGSNAEWFAVAMKAEGSAFFGVLPKPTKSLKAFRYYIEVTDKALGTNRTPDYTTDVIASSGDCKGKITAVSLASASVLLQGSAGVVALPVGFASTGVSVAGSAAGSSAGAAGAGAGGGGGLSTAAAIGIVGGVGAAAVGVVVATKGPAGTSYSGPISGQLSLTLTATGGGGGPVICGAVIALGGTLRLTLEDSGGTASGQGEITMTETQTGRFGDPGCGTAPAPRSSNSFNCPITGSSGGLSCSMQRAEGSGTLTFGFSGALGGSAISGTVTYGRTESSPASQGASASQTTGSTTFPVTLR